MELDEIRSRTKRVNQVLKPFYSHISLSQEYFGQWIKA